MFQIIYHDIFLGVTSRGVPAASAGKKEQLASPKFLNMILYHKITSLTNILGLRNLTKASIANVFVAAKTQFVFHGKNWLNSLLKEASKL